MMILTKEELLEIDGGAIRFSGVLVKETLKCFNFVLELGRNLGSAIRRYKDNNLCKIM
jgi:hypothetical protein